MPTEIPSALIWLRLVDLLEFFLPRSESFDDFFVFVRRHFVFVSFASPGGIAACGID